MTISVFVGVSVDGFLARPDGTLDFLEAGGNVDHGYDEFIATIDAIVIGRNTFDFVLPFKPWPYGKRRVVVLSHRPIDLSQIVDGNVEQMSGSPIEITSKLEVSGANHVYLDGGITIQEFLLAGLVNRLTVSRVPVLIGQGIPLFGVLPQDVHLRHICTKHYETGLVKSEYEVVSK